MEKPLIQLIKDLTWYNLVEKIKEILKKIQGSFIEDAPLDGKIYGRKDESWEEVVNGGGGSTPGLDEVLSVKNRASANIILCPNPDNTEEDEFGTMEFKFYEAKIKAKQPFVQEGSSILNFSTTSNNVELEFPDKENGTYIIATTDDIPEPIPIPEYTLNDVALNNNITNQNLTVTEGDPNLPVSGTDNHTTVEKDKIFIGTAADGGLTISTTSGTNQILSQIAGQSILSLDLNPRHIGLTQRYYGLMPIATPHIEYPNLLATCPILANYVDDVAAAGGGIVVGGMYHTSGVVKIRLT